eukprot:Rhum_TRINITY_DN14233_c24_g1::Rhum_TRINITY_DN14233_c24_g1_i1::g.76322::m.76322/K02206/CDK2; cyclin-dependent kinase 2
MLTPAPGTSQRCTESSAAVECASGDHAAAAAAIAAKAAAAAAAANNTRRRGSKVVGQLIGDGSYATVRYFARNELTGRDYVVKVPKEGETAHAALAWERKILLSLSHPNVIKTVVCGLAEHRSNLIMELMDFDLHRFVSQKGAAGVPLTERVLQGLFGEVLTGLAYLHKNGVAHLDVKLENILIRANPSSVVLSDFGTAVPFTDNTRDRSVAGTPGYKAPELAPGCERIGRAIAKPDVFSVGVSFVVAHTMVTPPCEEDYTPAGRVAELLRRCKVQGAATSCAADCLSESMSSVGTDTDLSSEEETMSLSASSTSLSIDEHHRSHSNNNNNTASTHHTLASPSPP